MSSGCAPTTRILRRKWSPAMSAIRGEPRQTRSTLHHRATTPARTRSDCITIAPMFEAPATAPMEFGDYLRILRRRAWVVVVVTVLGVGISYAWYSTQGEDLHRDRRGRRPRRGRARSTSSPRRRSSRARSSTSWRRSRSRTRSASPRSRAATPAASRSPPTAPTRKVAAASVNAEMDRLRRLPQAEGQRRVHRVVRATPAPDRLALAAIDALDALIQAGDTVAERPTTNERCWRRS